jgi:hypothetical protein
VLVRSRIITRALRRLCLVLGDQRASRDKDTQEPADVGEANQAASLEANEVDHAVVPWFVLSLPSVMLVG